jgi:hypothetical protein
MSEAVFSSLWFHGRSPAPLFTLHFSPPSLSPLDPCRRYLCVCGFLLRIFFHLPSVTDRRCNTQVTPQIANNRLAFRPNAGANVFLFSLAAHSFVTKQIGRNLRELKLLSIYYYLFTLEQTRSKLSAPLPNPSCRTSPWGLLSL